MEKTLISIGSDHAGFKLKEIISNHLKEKGFEVYDLGCYSDEKADYPDYAHAVAKSVLQHNTDYGILICGSGNGISMTANKYSGIRSAICWNSEIAELSRLHNDANILVLPARFISEEEAKKCTDVFHSTKFEGGRHFDRVSKINISEI